MKTQFITSLLALATVITASAEKPERRGERRPPPVPPVFAVIDTDRDGVLSAEEISAAGETLTKLDKNGDGEITPDELRLPPPPRERRERDTEDEPLPKPPPPPVIAALDTDRDGTLSAAELENAPESLKALDKNGDGKLSPQELRPPGPPPRGEGQGRGGRPPGPPPGEEEGETE